MSSIAVVEGTESRSSRPAGRLSVSQVTFAGGSRLHWHAHPRGCVAVVVEGAVEKRFAHSMVDARPGTLVTMPPEEPHEDVFGSEGARIVVVETDEAGGPVSWFRKSSAMLVAVRIASELALDDAFTPLALEGLGLELLAAAGRGCAPAPAAKWLLDVRDLLDEHYREPLAPSEIAARVGVHPSHLARAFRLHYGDSVGGYLRRLRLEWAAGELARGDTRLACLSVEAGFADQSHFTRAFKRQFGLTPARYRAAHR